MNYVFLDFDGVLFDTLKEAYILCRYAYDGTDFFEPIDDNEYQKLYRYKFLVYNSWQYYYLMTLIKENLTDNELITKYDTYLKNRDNEAEKGFDDKYYSGRKYLMGMHHDFWGKLESPFTFFEEIKKYTLEDKIIPIIVSKKNKAAIEYRLKQYSFNPDFLAIFGNDELKRYETKADFINEYMDTNNIKKAYFIDDNSNNLKPCQKYPQIETLLAGWGNIAINEKGYTTQEILDKILN